MIKIKRSSRSRAHGDEGLGCRRVAMLSIPSHSRAGQPAGDTMHSRGCGRTLSGAPQMTPSSLSRLAASSRAAPTYDVSGRAGRPKNSSAPPPKIMKYLRGRQTQCCRRTDPLMRVFARAGYHRQTLVDHPHRASLSRAGDFDTSCARKPMGICHGLCKRVVLFRSRSCRSGAIEADACRSVWNLEVQCRGPCRPHARRSSTRVGNSTARLKRRGVHG